VDVIRYEISWRLLRKSDNNRLVFPELLIDAYTVELNWR